MNIPVTNFGKEKMWWEFSLSDYIIGRLRLNLDGIILFTPRPELGFLTFSSLSFKETSIESLHRIIRLEKLSYSDWSFKLLGYLAGFLCIGVTAIYFIRKYDLLLYFDEYFNQKNYPRDNDSSDEQEDDLDIDDVINRLLEGSDDENKDEDEHELPRIQSTLCVICLDLQRNILLKPCKHFCLCENCAQSVQQCPVCRKEITMKEIVYNV